MDKIKVKVYALPMCSFEHIDDDGFILLDSGTTINQLYRRIKLPLYIQVMRLSRINYEKPRRNQALMDGDVVSFLFPVSGG